MKLPGVFELFWDDTGALDFAVADTQLGFSAARIANSFYNEHQSNCTIIPFEELFKIR
jgi:hypothetical protein